MKKITTALLSLIAGASFAQVPTTGLVAYYPFNGNANDLTANANNATVNNATLTTDRFGNANSAYSFNGTSAYLLASNTKGLDNNEYTISYWINVNTLPTSGNSQYIFDLGSEYSPNLVYGQVSGLNNNYFSTTGWSTGAGNTSNGVANGYLSLLPTPATWYNVTITRNKTSVNTYINNTPVSTATTNNVNAFYSSPNNLYIGGRTSLDATKFFNGKLDDFRIYNRVLTTSEIDALYKENQCTQLTLVPDTLLINLNTTGLNNSIFQNTVKVYPNPTADQLNINFGDFALMNGFTLQILNNVGNIVYTKAVTQQNESVLLNTFGGKGIYIVNILNAQGTSVDRKKVVLK